MGQYAKHIGLYDVQDQDSVSFNGRIIKPCGKKPPKDTISQGKFKIFFGEDFKAVAHEQERIDTAFINADEIKRSGQAMELVGVGYGGPVVIKIGDNDI